MLYADYNATSPLLPEVEEQMRPFFREEFGNPSSLHYALGRRAREAIEGARSRVASLLGAIHEEVVFVSSGTESCFSALIGAFLARPHRKRMVCSAVEHAAVLETLHLLEEPMFGCSVTKISPNKDGSLDLGKVSQAITPETGIVSFMLANNETGVVFPVKQICEMAHRQGALVHVDAVQAVGKMPLSFSDLGVDFISLTGHKFGAPKGIGALVIRKDLMNGEIQWKPVMRGGGQEGGRRGSTEAVPLIVGIGEAARSVKEFLANGHTEKLREVRDSFEKTLLQFLPDSVIHGSSTRRLVNTSSVFLRGILAQELLQSLGEKGVMFSAGAACKTKKAEPSHVLKSMGLSTMECLSTIRVSFGFNSLAEDGKFLAEMIAEEGTRLRERARVLVGEKLGLVNK